MRNLETAILQAIIILVPTYLVAYVTDKMIYTIPMLAAAGFLAAALTRETSERKIDEDGYKHKMKDGEHDDGSSG